MTEQKKIVYIAGPIIDAPDYYEAFDEAENDLRVMNFITLSPAHLSTDMPVDRYASVCAAMLDSADAVYLLEGWETSKDQYLTMTRDYARAKRLPIVTQKRVLLGEELDAIVRREWMKLELEEAIRWKY